MAETQRECRLDADIAAKGGYCFFDWVRINMSHGFLVVDT